ncbi:hypothetical protein [Methanosarcina barkeri]|uniref:hypothetical protein n=1 Tax=Methanosarcina barkeri TaxID=2208 RepID=UPI0006D2C85B|nr:hypothetical protein [Methanosarcina barkeri]
MVINHDEAFQRGLGLIKQKRYEKSINVFNKIVDKDPGHTGALFNRGLALLKIKKTRRSPRLL